MILLAAFVVLLGIEVEIGPLVFGPRSRSLSTVSCHSSIIVCSAAKPSVRGAGPDYNGRSDARV
jgi:hypothetical protein